MLQNFPFSCHSYFQELGLGEGWVNIQKRGITFVRQCLVEQDRPMHLDHTAFKENKILDQMRDPFHLFKENRDF